MRSKKIVSLIISLIILLSLSIDAMAITKPLKTSRVLTEGSMYQGFKIAGDYLYTAAGDNDGIYVIDISDPTAIKKVAHVELDIPAERDIDVYGDYLYAQENGRVVIFDIKNPLKPKKIAVASLNQTGRVAANGEILAIAGDTMLSLYNITNPKETRLITAISIPTNKWTNGIIIDEKSVCYVDDQWNFTVIDINDPENPVVAAQMNLPHNSTGGLGGACVYPKMIDGLCYFPTPEGIYIMDISDSYNPLIRTKWESGPSYSLCRSADKLYVVSNSVINEYKINSDDTVTFIDGYDANHFTYLREIELLDDRYIIHNTNVNVLVADFDLDPSEVSRYPKVPMEEDVLGTKEEIVVQMPFDDVRNHWAEAEILSLYKDGIVAGVSENAFEPERVITRAEFFKLIVKALSIRIEQNIGDYQDLSNKDWYSDILYTCIKRGLVAPETISGKKVRPNEPITREEMADAVIRAFTYSQKVISEEYPVSVSDTEEVSEWAKDSVLRILKSGIMLGDDTGKFNPEGATKRAEATAVITRMLKTLSDKRDNPEFLDNNKYEISDNIEGEFTDFAFKETTSQNAGAPQILHVSDAISKDEIFNVYGEELNSQTKVYIMRAGDEEEPDVSKAIECEIIGVDSDGTEHYVVCKTPKDIENGTYILWAENDKGLSSPVYLNGARAQWIDREVAAKGQKMRIIGRNLDGREYGAPLATSVAFIKDGKATNAELISVNPYCIELYPPEDIEDGEYQLAVTNDSKTWFEMEEDKTIYVKSKIDDPYDLEVPWADEFDYTVKADITKAPYNAPRDGSINVSKILQKAIDDVKNQGGGVVYIPEGTYKVAAIDLPAKVILAGDGMDKSILLYSNITENENGEEVDLGNYVIHSKGDGITEGVHGLYKLQIGQDMACKTPDHYMWFGQNGWGSEVTSVKLRTASRIFMKEVKLNSPMEQRPGDLRALGIVGMLKSDFLMENCITYGYQSTPSVLNIGDRTYLYNNIYYAVTTSIGVNGSRSICEGNLSNRYPELFDEVTGAQGFFFRDHAYYTENEERVSSSWGINVGEAFCAEIYLGGNKLNGYVVSADENSVTYGGGVREYKATYYPELYNVKDYAYNNGWHLCIANGKGVGQSRVIKEIDKENKKIILEDGSWEIMPDETSYFTISLPIDNVTVYNNYAYTNDKGFWIFGNSYDSVVAKNILIDVQGVYSHSLQTVENEMFSAFLRFEGNKTLGYSTKTQSCGIGLAGGPETPDIKILTHFGFEVKDNYMEGGEKGEPYQVHPAETESPSHDGIYIQNSLRESQDSNVHNWVKGVIIEDNTIKNMKTGIVSAFWTDRGVKNERAYTDTVYCRNNSFINVENEYADELGIFKVVE